MEPDLTPDMASKATRKSVSSNRDVVVNQLPIKQFIYIGIWPIVKFSKCNQ